MASGFEGGFPVRIRKTSRKIATISWRPPAPLFTLQSKKVRLLLLGKFLLPLALLLALLGDTHARTHTSTPAVVVFVYTIPTEFTKGRVKLASEKEPKENYETTTNIRVTGREVIRSLAREEREKSAFEPEMNPTDGPDRSCWK